MMMSKKQQLFLVASVLIFSCRLQASNEHESKHLEDLIISFDITKKKLEVQIHEGFKEKYLTNDFFAVYDDEDVDLTALDKSLALMPFLCNVVTIVWISGKKYAVDCMDEDLYYALEKIKRVFQRMYPKTRWEGELIPRNLVKNYSSTNLKDPQKHIALLYSAGLDSTSSSFYHFDRQQLLITAWGQYDVPLQKPELWTKRKEQFVEFAQKYGHTNSFVKSNYAAFLNWEVLGAISSEVIMWREDANEGIGMAGLVAPILLAKGYSDLYIASSFTWDYPYPSAANPFVDNTIRFAHNFRVKHDQFGFTRIDKLASISRIVKEENVDIPVMKVCAGPKSYNCCNNCNKCLHTIMALLVLGEDLAPWGFAITPEEAIARIKKSLKGELDYWVRWNFLCIKKKMRRMLAQGKHVPTNVLWLLDEPLNQNITMWHSPQRKEYVHWQNFKDLAPTSLKVPSVKLLRLEADEIGE